MRLHTIMPEYRRRIALTAMAFPLELGDGEPPPRDILEQEWWLAALQEPRATFHPFNGNDFPTTTLPAFDAAKAAERQEEEVGQAYDLRIRQAFFVDSLNIGRPEVLRSLAREVGLDMVRFDRDLVSGQMREQVLAERSLGREQRGIRGTPTLLLPDGKHARLPIAAPRMRDRRIVAVPSLPCCGDGCLDAMRRLLDQAMGSGLPAIP